MIIANDPPLIDLTAVQDNPPRVALGKAANNFEREDYWEVSRSSRGCARREPGYYKVYDDAADHANFEDSDDEVQVTEAPAASRSITAYQTPAINASRISQNTSATEPIPNNGATNATLPDSNGRIKKRRALEDALEDIEFEQRKRRVQRELDRLMEDGE
jgi:hypothetical protein